MLRLSGLLAVSSYLMRSEEVRDFRLIRCTTGCLEDKIDQLIVTRIDASVIDLQKDQGRFEADPLVPSTNGWFITR